MKLGYGGTGRNPPYGDTAKTRTHKGLPPTHEWAEGVPLRQLVIWGMRCGVLRGCTDNGDRDQPIPASQCASLPTQQRADHHPAIHGYESLPDLCLPLRWFRSIRSDGSGDRMLGCRVPSVRLVTCEL